MLAGFRSASRSVYGGSGGHGMPVSRATRRATHIQHVHGPYPRQPASLPETSLPTTTASGIAFVVLSLGYVTNVATGSGNPVANSAFAWLLSVPGLRGGCGTCGTPVVAGLGRTGRPGRAVVVMRAGIGMPGKPNKRQKTKLRPPVNRPWCVSRVQRVM